MTVAIQPASSDFKIGSESKRPFNILINQCVIFKSVFSQNGKDGIKSKDYKCHILGCKIQGNLNNALTMVQPNEAEASLYLKTKNNENDLIGRIIGGNGVRYRPRTVLESNLSFLYKQMRDLQSKQLYEELVQLGMSL